MPTKIKKISKPVPDNTDAAINLYIQHQVGISQYTKTEITKALTQLERTQKAIINTLNTTPELTELSQIRLANELGGVSGQIQEGYKSINKEYKGSSADFVLSESGWQKDALSALSAGDVPIISLAEITKSNPINFFEGKTFTQHLSKLQSKDKKAIKQAIIRGVALGRSNAEIAREIPSALKLGKRDVTTLVRTGIQSNSAAVREGYFTNNTDIIEAIIWSSTLDGRTTQTICAPRDGLRYEVVDKKPIGHSLPWIGGPPAHFNCRSSSVPVVTGVERTGQRQGVDFNKEAKGNARSGIRVETGAGGTVTGTLNKGQRAEFSKKMGKGQQYSGKTNFEGWLHKQPKWFQDDYLGPTKAKLFRKGGLSLENFSEKTGKAITLKQLQKRFPKQWATAFADNVPEKVKAVKSVAKKVVKKSAVKSGLGKKMKEAVKIKTVPKPKIKAKVAPKPKVIPKAKAKPKPTITTVLTENRITEKRISSIGNSGTPKTIAESMNPKKLIKSSDDLFSLTKAEKVSSIDTLIINKLVGDPDVDALYDHFFYIKQKGTKPVQLVSKFENQWAAASSNELPMMVQMVAESEFGVSGIEWKYYKKSFSARERMKDIKDLFKSDPAIERGARKLARAMYDNTQDYLTKNGINEVYMFRGVGDVDISDIRAMTKNASASEKKAIDKLASGISETKTVTLDADIRQQALSSWSTDAAVAIDFGVDGFDGTALLHQAVVPKEKIFSIHQTGGGTIRESEAVIFGGFDEKITTTIYNTVEALGYNGFRYRQSPIQQSAVRVDLKTNRKISRHVLDLGKKKNIIDLDDVSSRSIKDPDFDINNFG
jgi:hypothetical protein